MSHEGMLWINKNQGLLIFAVGQGLLEDGQHKSEMCWRLNDPSSQHRDCREDKRLFTQALWLLETSQLQLESLEHRSRLLLSLPTWGSRRTIGSLSCCLLAQDKRDENAHLQGHKAKQTKCPAHRKLLCPSYQPCPHLWSTTFLPELPAGHKGQLMSTNVSKIWCSTLVVPMVSGTEMTPWQNDVFDCFKCKACVWDMSVTQRRAVGKYRNLDS